MAINTYDRYSLFRHDGKIDIVPTVKIPEKSSDYFITYNAGHTRLDIVSNDYYGNPNYDWLIMVANPEYGSMEFSIPDGVELRIPYPLDVTLQDYASAVSRYKTLYK